MKVLCLLFFQTGVAFKRENRWIFLAPDHILDELRVVEIRTITPRWRWITGSVL
tara:strand:+ start:144 stop:305 length:162 start_codon:yes stop_codon:yes gene_type:complete